MSSWQRVDAVPDPLSPDVNGRVVFGEGNGITALMEYFLGSSDSIADSGVLPVIVEGTRSLAGYPIFSFQINLAADDLVYKVQQSIDLAPGNWTSTPEVELVSLNDNGDGTATVVWRSTPPLAGLPRQFMRLQIFERP